MEQVIFVCSPVFAVKMQAMSTMIHANDRICSHTTSNRTYGIKVQRIVMLYCQVNAVASQANYYTPYWYFVTRRVCVLGARSGPSIETGLEFRAFQSLCDGRVTN